jgi:aminopeptidase YwaD
MWALPLLLAATFDGSAALRHASSLASLGPHPWGSPRGRAAAEYVAAQFRQVGLAEVAFHEFEGGGRSGRNVVGTLRGAGSELLIIGAHHDSVPEAPGAYDDGGGVGVLIEAARVLAHEPRSRTLVFVSWDAEESESVSAEKAAGSRAYVRSLGPSVRDLVAVLDIEMSGFGAGSPTLHPIAYADPLRPGAQLVAPGWLVRTALAGAREASSPLNVGDPLIAWLYQPAVRVFRARLYGDDISFVQAGLPAVFVSDSSFAYFYPHYHQPSDTADKLSPQALEKMGKTVLGAVRALDKISRGPTSDPTWFAAGGYVLGAPVVFGLGAFSLVPGLLRTSRGRGLALRLLHAGLFLTLLWRHPVAAAWIFLLPNLLPPLVRPRWAVPLGLLPLLGLLALGLFAWLRSVGPSGSAIAGVWLAPWEIGLVLLALLLAFVPMASAPGRGPRRLRMRPVRR